MVEGVVGAGVSGSVVLGTFCRIWSFRVGAGRELLTAAVVVFVGVEAEAMGAVVVEVFGRVVPPFFGCLARRERVLVGLALGAASVVNVV